uniref:UDP-N-acetylglucosamine--peptide N-acetylglucosaminyltransferase SPINDLY n=1 Tax=Phaeomonas parva TaxID=124430 RepID=A0A7S1XN54_9STRA|mmetsp:Transcript_23557/g.73929  ORF Transcript_23557/g.73929 Transcript_23557/m.73929 type:complete len:1012 (+) Transcript_23557:293-3328(+)
MAFAGGSRQRQTWCLVAVAAAVLLHQDHGALAFHRRAPQRSSRGRLQPGSYHAGGVASANVGVGTRLHEAPTEQGVDIVEAATATGGQTKQGPDQRGGLRRKPASDRAAARQKHNNKGRNKSHNNNSNNNNDKRKGKKSNSALIEKFHDARAALRRGEKEVGQGMLYDCLALNVQDGPSWLALAKSEIKTGNKTGARDVFREALGHTESVHLLQAWAVMERDEGNVAVARELFERAAQIEPGNSYVAHAWGLMEEQEGDVDRARELYQSALETNPTAAVVAALALLEAFHDNEPRGAIRLLQDTANDPKFRYRSEDLHLAIAHIYETVMLQPDRASEALKVAVECNPRSVRVRVFAAKLEMRRGDLHRAEALLNEARDKDVNLDPWLYNSLAMLQARDARIAEAQDTIREGIERMPFDGALLQTAGTLAHRRGDLDEAARFYKKSLRFRKHGSTYVGYAAVEEQRAVAQQEREAKEVAATAAALATGAAGRTEGADAAADAGDMLELEPKIRAAASGSNNVEAVAAAASEAGMAGDDDGGFNYDDFSESEDEEYASPEDEFGSSVEKLRSTIGGKTLDELFENPKSEHRRRKRWAAEALQPARRLFQEGLTQDPNHGALYNAYATMEARYGNVTGARAIYSAGLASGVSECQVSLYHGAGNLEAASGNVEGARRLWKAGISVLRKARGMESAEFCYHSLGMSYLSANHQLQAAPNAEYVAPNATAAALVFAEGLQRYPASSQLLLGAALAEVKRNNLDRAREFFRKSAAANKRHAQAWQAWAVMETRERNHENAATLFECGIENCPDHGALYQAYGMLQLYRGDVPGARKLFAKGINRCPSHVPLYQGWACLELRSGQLERARELLLSALSQDRKHASCWAALGELESQASQPDLARKTFQRGLVECPNSGQLFRAAARLEAELLNYSRARRLFEEGLERCPYDAPLLASFAEFEASLGNVEALAKLHHRAMEIQQIAHSDQADIADDEEAPQEMKRVLAELGGNWDPLGL